RPRLGPEIRHRLNHRSAGVPPALPAKWIKTWGRRSERSGLHMRIVITGGCGFLGRRVALKLLAEGCPLGPVDELVLFDNARSALPLPDDKRLSLVTGDIADRATVARVIGPGTDAVFHLAAIVSGQAEADTDLGYRVNLDGTRAVLDACRALRTAPRLVFA